MSHEYLMRIEIHGTREDEKERLLDEIVPKWWNGDYGRDKEILWVEGKDRLTGGSIPGSFRADLEKHLESLLGRRLRVVVSGTDKEGYQEGRRFRSEEVHDMAFVDEDGTVNPSPCGDVWPNRRISPTRGSITCLRCLAATKEKKRT